jgi:predicted N-acetyltransferase YhbS
MIVIRPARPSDAARLPAVERSAGRAFAVLPDLAWIADDDVLSETRHLELIATGDTRVAVDEDDLPVGFAAAEEIDGAFHLWELSVRHDLQGRGIGRRLVAATVAAARRRGLAAVTLTTFVDVAWNRPFYERQGFRVVDECDLSVRLRAVLDAEVAAGLVRTSRCAMIHRLV